MLVTFGSNTAISSYGDHALLEAYAQDLVLEFHAESLECVNVALPHFQEHQVQLLLRVFLVLLDPLDETVRALDILINSRPLQYRVECLLGVALHNILLVGHQLDDSLQDGELA